MYANSHVGNTSKNENSFDEMGFPRWIPNFKIEARECDNITQRKIVWEYNHGNSHATHKRKKKRRSRNRKNQQVKNFKQFSKLEYLLPSNILCVTLNGNIGSKYHFQTLKKQHESKPKVLKRCQKPIKCVKSTAEYKNYLQLVSKMKRNRNLHAFTPQKQFKWSRWLFDNQVKKWPKKLHRWEQVPCFDSSGGNYNSLENSNVMLESFSDKNSEFKNDFTGQLRKNYLDIVREESEKYTEFKNNLNRPDIEKNYNPSNMQNPYNYNAFKNDYNSLVEMRNSSETAVEEVEKQEEFGFNKTFRENNYPIRMENSNGSVQMRKHPLEINSEKFKNCNDSNLNFVSNKFYNPVNPEDFKYIGTEFNAFENNFNGAIQTRRYPFRVSCPNDGRIDVAKNWNFMKNYIDRILLYPKPLLDPTARSLMNTSHSENKVTNAEIKIRRNILGKKATRNKFRKNQIFRANVKNCQYRRKDLVNDKQESHRQKCNLEESSFKSNPDQFDDIWKSRFYIMDEWNEKGRPLEEEEEILNLNSVLQQGENEFPANRTDVQKRFQPIAASFTSTDELNCERDFGYLKRTLNCASSKNSSWDSSSSNTSSESEDDGKRSWKKFERNCSKV